MEKVDLCEQLVKCWDMPIERALLERMIEKQYPEMKKNIIQWAWIANESPHAYQKSFASVVAWLRNLPDKEHYSPNDTGIMVLRWYDAPNAKD